MDPHGLLIRHAQDWASRRSRPLDEDLVSTALELRLTYDELSATHWPAGSAERVMLVTWPAYGPDPDPERLHNSLDTFWSFLRATGRMAPHSAAPAELRREGKRSWPKMREAYDDPTRHSQGRVLADFGRSVGIDLDGAADVNDLQRRMQRVQDAWNSLPTEERRRLMPDPSPKSSRASEMTRSIQPPRDDGRAATPEEMRAAADDARSAGFVRACLALVEWLAPSRTVTRAGLLRPAVAREAYQHLDLWPWERALDEIRYQRHGRALALAPEADEFRAHAALNSWTSAGDCFPLDRLWYAVTVAGRVDVRSTTAVPSKPAPSNDQEWANLGLALAVGLALRLPPTIAGPLELLLVSCAHGEGSLLAMRRAWRDTVPAEVADLLGDFWEANFDEMVFVFNDAGLWHVDGDRVRLTMLGTFFLDPFTELVEDGTIEVR